MLKTARKTTALSEMGVSRDTLHEMYELMLMARRLDERIWLLNRSGKLPFNISGQGQEGAQIASAFAFDRQIDYTLPYYRDLAVVLAFGMTAQEVLLSAFGKAEDPNSGGRQMPAHYGHKAHRIVSQSSPVTTQFPHAAGIALAAKMANDPIVAYTSCGEGSSNQGDFHEGINFASVHALPVVFVIENNQYAISVPQALQYKAAQLSDRAVGYGIPGETVDGNDFAAVYLAFQRAVRRARAGEGPTLIETVTYRFTPHSSDDDDRSYRSRAEVDAARLDDPLAIFEAQLLDEGHSDADNLAAIAERVSLEIQAATTYAEEAAAPQRETLGLHVYDESQGGD